MAYRTSSAVLTSTASFTANPLTVTAPSGVQNGDLVVLLINDNDSGLATWSCTGFTFVQGGFYVGSQQSSVSHSFLWKIAASEPGTYSVNIGTTPPSAPVDVIAACWTGRNTGSPITASTFTGTAGGASPHTVLLAGVTAAAGDDIIFVAGNLKSNASSWALPPQLGGFTLGLFGVGPSPFWNQYFAYVDNYAGGATGNISSVETGAAIDNAGMVIALAAAAAPGYIPPGSFVAYQGQPILAQ